MAGHIVGYARVSTREQNSALQEAALQGAGAERIFVDHGESSRKVSRPQWDACLDYLRSDDVLLVYRLDRLSGSAAHLISLIHDLGERGVDLRSLTEPVAHARAKGRVGGRPTKVTEEKLKTALTLRGEGETIAFIAKSIDLGEATVKRALKKARETAEADA